jgi:hypothetical protein
METEIKLFLCYPEFNKPFHVYHVYTDASDHQLGAVIIQDRKPIAFYSRKLNTTPKSDIQTLRES